MLLWLLWPLPGWTPVCSPLGLARHPLGGPGLRRAWTDGAVEGGSWKHTQPVEEPKTKMGKLKTPSNVGQEEKGQCRLSGEPEELAEEGQPVLQHSSPTRFGALQRRFSFLLSLKGLQSAGSSTTWFFR